MLSRSLGCALAAMLFAAPAAMAQEAALPDPAGIALPPLTFGTDPEIQKNGYKFFFFHNPSISFADAYGDFAQCRSLLASGVARTLPSFVPWVEANSKEVERGFSPYGLVGEAMLAIIEPKLIRGQRNNKMRLCMERRGYVRYAIDEAGYDALHEGDEPVVVARFAKLATGPAPAAEVVTR